ncbi:ecdysone oxidase-like isoform X2 [Plutella xylostella]|uniref:ecdysone oxidase-like isoform X2 n=1 Tax=Plutella xylostella TaxID=51655 RepID=UPI002032A146|nr:ecdysone oxidase-like isoform X2 [Plutella xylostella]
MVLGDALDPVAPVASTFTLLQTVQLLASTMNYTRQRGPDSASVTNGSTFDIIIVGGGTAGLVVANRLSEVQDWRVLVVEAGDDPSLVSGIPGLFPFLIRSGEDWGFQNVYEPEYAQGLNNNTSYLPAGKCLGGSSSIHDLLYERRRSRQQPEGLPPVPSPGCRRQCLPDAAVQQDLRPRCDGG